MTFSKERLEELAMVADDINVGDCVDDNHECEWRMPAKDYRILRQAAKALPQYIEALRYFPSNTTHGAIKSKTQWEREIAEWAVKNQSALHTLSQPQREG